MYKELHQLQFVHAHVFDCKRHLRTAGTESAVTAPQMRAFAIGQSLSVADFLAGAGLAPRAGLTITVRCEDAAPSSAAVVGCAFNNRYSSAL